MPECVLLEFWINPIGSMYGIFTYIWLIFMVNVGKYTSPMDPMGMVRKQGYSMLQACFSGANC